MQPISVTDIRSYCELFKIESLVERDSLFRMIRRLDGVYLKKQSEKLKP